MITAVDTSVLLDVFVADTTYGERSREALCRCGHEGRVVAYDIVWAEVTASFPDADREITDMWEHLGLGYTESTGHPLLRHEIAKFYTHIDADHTIGFVPEEGIFAFMNVVLSAGDQVIATYPGYQSLHEIADSLGCEVIRWEPERSAWGFDVQFAIDT